MRHTKGRRGGLRVRLIVLLGLCAAALAGFAALTRPLLVDYAGNAMQYTATREMDSVVTALLYQNRERYQGLVQLERDSTERVTALRTDSILLDSIKAQMVEAVYGAVNELEQQTLEIPLGSILAPTLLSGKGPRIAVICDGLAFADAQFVSAFTAAGLNQTRHNIILQLHAELSVRAGWTRQTVSLDSPFVLTDTVIVGTVPEHYSYIEDSTKGILGEVSDLEENMD